MFLKLEITIDISKKKREKPNIFDSNIYDYFALSIKSFDSFEEQKRYAKIKTLNISPFLIECLQSLIYTFH